jgi:hypothetical protein
MPSEHPKEMPVQEHHPDLTIEYPADSAVDGLIVLRQEDGTENGSCVALSPMQVRYLAEKVGLTARERGLELQVVAGLERRLGLLRERLDNMVQMAQAGALDHVPTLLQAELMATTALAHEWSRESTQATVLPR